MSFPPPRSYIQRPSYALAGCTERAVLNDIRGVLRPPQLDPARAAVAAVDVPAQVCTRRTLGERGQLGARDLGYSSGSARDRLCFARHEHRASYRLV